MTSSPVGVEMMRKVGHPLAGAVTYVVFAEPPVVDRALSSSSSARTTCVTRDCLGNRNNDVAKPTAMKPTEIQNPVVMASTNALLAPSITFAATSGWIEFAATWTTPIPSLAMSTTLAGTLPLSWSWTLLR